jgi:hypothetical protein
MLQHVLLSFNVTAALLVAIVTILLALLFDWFPGLASAYDKLVEGKKRLVMVLLIILTSAAIFAGTCYGLFGTNLECTVSGAGVLLIMAYTAIGTVFNQATHTLFKPSNAFKASVKWLPNPK